MYRSLTTCLKVTLAGFCLVAAAVHAEEAGRVVFTVGGASLTGKPVVVGQAVQEGDEITTEATGFVYVKTVDNGFLILRPNSRARVVDYHVDKLDPAGTRIKLELLAGVARHISGDAVKRAKQNFRFNTPVAAIGVRGTDYTVYTNATTSSVAVLSGGVVVSGFSATCGAEGHGPCEGGMSRELFAAQIGQILEVRKGQAAPTILPANSLLPDLIAPPRSDEPAVKPTATGSAPAAAQGAGNTIGGGASTVSLDAKKDADVVAHLAPPLAVLPPPLPVVTPPDPVVPLPPLKEIIWGRWTAVLGQPVTMDLSKVLTDKGSLIGTNSNFAIASTAGRAWDMPSSGAIGFALKQSEAYVLFESTHTLSAAQLENGKLMVDFGKATFDTSFDLLSKGDHFSMRSQGNMTSDGQLFGNSQFSSPTNMAVSGLVNPAVGTAAYIFQGRLDSSRVASGVTVWGK